MGSQSSMIESFIQESRQQDLIQIDPKQVDQFFTAWNNELNELPLSFRHDIVKLARPKKSSMHEIIVSLEEQEQHMYLIVEGSALLFKSEYCLKKFQQQLTTVQAQKEEKAHLVSNPNFSNLVHVGTILLQFILKDPLS